METIMAVYWKMKSQRENGLRKDIGYLFKKIIHDIYTERVLYISLIMRTNLNCAPQCVIILYKSSKLINFTLKFTLGGNNI